MRTLTIAVLALVICGAVIALLPRHTEVIRDRLSALALDASDDEALRLVVFGTSLTSNYSWPDVLAAKMSECSGRPVEPIRVAQAGANSGWALDNVNRVIAAVPDIVLIEFAINDADVLDGVRYRESMSNHRELVQLLNQSLPDAKIVLMTMSHAHGPRGWVRPFLARYYSGYVELADQMDIDLVDLFPRWIARKRLGLKFQDGLHPDDDVAVQVMDMAMSQAVLGVWFPNDLC